MKFKEIELNYPTQKIFVLGAGASADYGIPTWSSLSEMVIKHLDKDTQGKYKYKTEICTWLEKVGDKTLGKTYSTIDECISAESVTTKYRITGTDIEEEIFKIISEVFSEKYHKNEDGWIHKLSMKVVADELGGLERQIMFVNYNYDDVLEKNFLNFESLSHKQRELIHGEIISILSGKRLLALHPHGAFGPNDEDCRIWKSVKTIKTGKGYTDAISCYDSGGYLLKSPVHYPYKFTLYIMGLGGGMFINLPKLKFNELIEKIYVTVRDEAQKENITDFLSDLYSVEPTNIIAYPSCDALIEGAL